ncbi:hypothetical protein G9P44_005690 [Scheffersomyces stipitis]|nr:hypothetical protein G9P44_005690 [Scheffersomyces stipitis]
MTWTKRDFLDLSADSTFGSTAFNLGKDPLLHQLEQVREYSEQDLLANMIYIFLLLVFATVVLGAVSFGVREYYLSMKSKLDTATSPFTPQAEDEIWNARNDQIQTTPALPESNAPSSNLKQLPMESEESQNRLSENSLASGFTHFTENRVQSQKNHTIEETESSNQGLSGSLEQVTELEKIQIFRDDIESPGLKHFMSADISKGENLLSEKDSPQEPSPPPPPPPTRVRTKSKTNKKTTYSISHLLSLNNDISTKYLTHRLKSRSIKMSKILRYSADIPATEFETAWNANKSVNDARAKLEMNEAGDSDFETDSDAGSDYGDKNKCTGCIAVLQLLSIGVSDPILGNPNYFLPAFNDLIEHLIDTGQVFQVLVYSVRSHSQLLLLEMMLIYCWSHWNYRSNDSSAIQRQFQKWNLVEPVVRSRDTIFRYLCNLQLGLAANYTEISLSSTPSFINEGEFRIHLLLREAVKSFCNDYMQFIPMIAQAVDVAQLHNTKVLFYDLLHVLLQKHSQCCMAEYLSEDNTDLKALVQHGLWHKHNHRLHKYSYRILHFLLEQGDHNLVESWERQVEGGKLYVPSAGVVANATVSANSPQQSSGINMYATALQKPITPGGLSYGLLSGLVYGTQRHSSMRRKLAREL